MRSFVVDCWNHIMDAEINPLRNIPDPNVRHMIRRFWHLCGRLFFPITFCRQHYGVWY